MMPVPRGAGAGAGRPSVVHVGEARRGSCIFPGESSLNAHPATGVDGFVIEIDRNWPGQRAMVCSEEAVYCASTWWPWV